MLDFARMAEREGLVDKRKKSWVTHSCSLILIMIMVGLLQGCKSIRAIERLFHGKATAPKMREIFDPYFGEELKVNGFPTFSCIDRFIQTADTQALAVYLCQWSHQLIHDDGIHERSWGVDGQAARASKRVKAGGRPLYNVDYHDNESNILVYLVSVASKSQEATVTRDTVQDVLSGHPNVVLGADAMMTKKGILEAANQVGAKTFMPVKRNNPYLMNGFTQTIEDLTFSGSSVVSHYVDLDGLEDGVGHNVIQDTVCSYEEEDNKNYDADLKSRSVREVKFFDDIYQYREADTLSLPLILTPKEAGTRLVIDISSWFLLIAEASEESTSL